MRKMWIVCFAVLCFPLSAHALDVPSPSTAGGWQEVMPTPTDLTASATNDHEVYSLIEHRGLLYIGYYTAGTPNATRAARLYTWDGKTQQLKYTFGTGLSFASLQALGEYRGDLYAAMSGLYNGDGDIYVSKDGGTSWIKSFEATTDVFCSSLVVFKDKLYAGMGYKASRILAFDGTTWNTVYPGKAGSGLVEWMYVYKGRLYAALGGPTAGRAAIVVTSDGVNWNVDYDNALASAIYNEAATMVAFKGKLYAGMLKGGTTGGDVLVRDDAAGTWSVAWSNPNGNRIHAMEVYNGRLYVGNANMDGAGDVYVSDDGVNFKKDLDTNVKEVFRLYAHNGSLYMGSGYLSGQARIWRKNDAEALRLALRSLWSDEGAYLRDYLVSVLSLTGDMTTIEENWLVHEHKIADALRPYYGDAAAENFKGILAERVMIAKRAREAHRQGNGSGVAQAFTDWAANARALATFLGGINEYINTEELSALLTRYVSHGQEMIVARAAGNWAADREAYDAMRRAALKIADTLSDAVVHGFSQRFEY